MPFAGKRSAHSRILMDENLITTALQRSQNQRWSRGEPLIALVEGGPPAHRNFWSPHHSKREEREGKAREREEEEEARGVRSIPKVTPVRDVKS